MERAKSRQNALESPFQAEEEGTTGPKGHVSGIVGSRLVVP